MTSTTRDKATAFSCDDVAVMLDSVAVWNADLSEEDMKRVTVHASTCPGCGRLAPLIEVFSNITGHEPDEADPEQSRMERLRDRVVFCRRQDVQHKHESLWLGTLSEGGIKRLAEHVKHCITCRSYVNSMLVDVAKTRPTDLLTNTQIRKPRLLGLLLQVGASYDLKSRSK